MPAGNLHAYLRGAGVEIMAASDNVLRGGLTPKHVDVAETAAGAAVRGAGRPGAAPATARRRALVDLAGAGAPTSRCVKAAPDGGAGR